MGARGIPGKESKMSDRSTRKQYYAPAGLKSGTPTAQQKSGQSASRRELPQSVSAKPAESKPESVDQPLNTYIPLPLSGNLRVFLYP